MQAGALGGTRSAGSNLITHSDPFPAGESYNHDSTVEIHILKTFIPETEVLVNVCSYPSAGNGGNNNPFDCIVSPGGGFLQIVKDAGAGVTSPNFTFDVHRSNTLLAQKTIAGSGTAALIPILVDPSQWPERRGHGDEHQLSMAVDHRRLHHPRNTAGRNRHVRTREQPGHGGLDPIREP